MFEKKICFQKKCSHGDCKKGENRNQSGILLPGE